jgi:hypothetical protein
MGHEAHRCAAQCTRQLWQRTRSALPRLAARCAAPGWLPGSRRQAAAAPEARALRARRRCCPPSAAAAAAAPRRREKRYSRGIRQAVHRAFKELGWERKYGMRIGTPQEVPGDYSDLLAKSVFCLVMPGGDGQGWLAGWR